MTAAATELTGATAPGKPQGPSAATILAALQRHYRRPGTERDGEVLIAEAQAPGSARRADLVRVGMWASRGLGIDVHEIKTSRSDWRRELDDPAKAEAWWPYCNRFWVVAPPGVVTAAELPEGWGLMELPASGRRFKIRVPAETRKDITLTVPLLVELLRRADNQRLAEIDELRRQHRDSIAELDRTWRAKTDDGSGLSWENRQRLDLLQQIEDALGVPLDTHAGWPRTPLKAVTPAELAAFLADARDHVTIQRRKEDLDHQRRRLREAAAGLLEHLDPPAPQAGKHP
jgi:hypothetical protein